MRMRMVVVQFKGNWEACEWGPGRERETFKIIAGARTCTYTKLTQFQKRSTRIGTTPLYNTSQKRRNTFNSGVVVVVVVIAVRRNKGG